MELGLSWYQGFFDPIILPGRKPLVTLRDAAHYIMSLPEVRGCEPKHRPSLPPAAIRIDTHDIDASDPPPQQHPPFLLPSSRRARGTAATHLPRFRALALFGRRPPYRVDRPASRRPKTCT